MKHSLSLPMLLFATLLVWALMTPRQTLLLPTPQPPAEPARVPDSYARNVIVDEFDERGLLMHRMEATELERYAPEEVTELTSPQRVSFSKKGPWTVRADSGRLNEKPQTLLLEGDVALSYVDRDTDVYSEAMLINLQARTARSLAPVRINQEGNRIRAPQLFLSLDAQRAALSGGVHSVYESPR